MSARNIRDLEQQICCLKAQIARCCGQSGGTITTLAANFVLRQDDPSPAGNVYANWATLGPALAATAGPKLVAVDPSINPVAVVTAGSWPVAGTTFVGLPSAFSGVRLQLAPGSVLIDPWGIDHGLFMEGLGDGNAQITFSLPGFGGPDAFTIGIGSAIYSANGNPIFRVGANRFQVLAALLGGSIGGNGNPVVALDDPTAQLIAGLATYGQLGSGAVSGNGVISVQYDDSCVLPDTLPAFSGTYGAQVQAIVPTRLVYADIVNGSDTQGNGSSRRPFRTLAKAISTAIANGGATTVYLAPGTYDGETLPVLPSFTIEGQGGGAQDQGSVVISGVGVPALALTPAPADANAIQAVTVRNLQLVSDTVGLQIAAATPGSFLAQGFLLENCRVSAPTALLMSRLNRISATQCSFEGPIDATQVGDGLLLDCTGNDQFTIDFDTSQPMPIVGRLPFKMQNTKTSGDLLLVNNPWLSVDLVSEAANLLNGGLIDVGGQGVAVEFHGKAFSIILELPEPSGILPPLINLDNSKSSDVQVFPAVSGPGARFPVSARNVTWDALGTTVIAERCDFDMRGGVYNLQGVVTGGSGADAGTFDRDKDFENGSLFTGVNSLSFANRFPPGALYQVSVQFSAVGAVADQVAILNPTPGGFDYQAAIGGQTCIFLITRK